MERARFRCCRTTAGRVPEPLRAPSRGVEQLEAVIGTVLGQFVRVKNQGGA